MTSPIYAIGDIHGQAAELSRVLDLIESDGGPDARIVFLGDYTDRGPDSCAVLNTLANGQLQGRNWSFLMGNHDRMFNWFLEDSPRHDAHLPVALYWLHERLGGDTTLRSYGLKVTDKRRLSDIHAEARSAIPSSHVTFMRGLKLHHEVEHLFFAHAGIRPGVALADQSEHDLLWIRDEFHAVTAPHPKLIVHGHTPVKSASHHGNRINLDTGAGYGKPLTAAVFEATDCWVLTAQGRNRLRP
tara:strand:+ start:63744 stop:64472 length:729 start_codon:yes stop_codon:yes gene_type:complete